MSERLNSLGLIGCGKMGGAIAQAVVARGVVSPERLLLADRADARAAALADLTGGRVAPSVEDLGRDAEVVVLAVKPQDAVKALAAVRWPEGEPRAVISVVAGLRLETLQGALPDSVAVVRAMPNTPALIGQGVTGVMSGSERALEQARLVFEACGAVVVLEKEALFDPLTALSGSGPAYVFVAIEALADGGVRMGLPRDVALELATRTVHGSAALVSETGRHPAQLKDDVASPGGTTINGLAELERAGFRAALIEAVTAATRRGQELGAQAAKDGSNP